VVSHLVFHSGVVYRDHYVRLHGVLGTRGAFGCGFFRFVEYVPKAPGESMRYEV
jgi:hypothetical protein